MTDPIANKVGVANLGTVRNQTNYITINQGQEVALIYSDPMPDLRLFQGRVAEQAELKGWLADRAVSIIGIRGEGGIGKSTLMAKVFAESPEFVGKFWADVRTGTSITALAARALQEFGVLPEQVQAIEEKDLIPRLLRRLQQERYLLAIDNLETVLTANGEWQSGYDQFFDGFQELGSESVLLLGSREYPPRYFGWKQSRWPPMVDGLQATEGAALLAALEVEDTAENRATLSTQVQGNPLALALMAGWLRETYRPGERLVEQLQQQTDLFQVAGKHRGEAQISVDHVLHWSLDRLTPAQRHLLTQVSVLRGAFNNNVATALVSEQSVSDADLEDLERRSLVQRLPDRDREGLLQFRLQPRIREYLQRHTPDLTTAHERAISYFWSQRRTYFAPDDTLDATSHYEATFYHQCQLGRYPDAASTILACDDFLRRCGYYQALLSLYRPLHTDWRPTPEQQQTYADVCNNLGGTYHSLGQYLQAINFYEQSLAIKREIGDRKGEENSLGNLGNAYHSLGQYPQAINFYEQSLAIARKIVDRSGEAKSLIGLGNACISLGQYSQAVNFYEQSLAIVHEIGDHSGEAGSLTGLGNAYYSLGQYPQAIGFHQKSLAIERKIGYRSGEATSLQNLGNAYSSLGKHRQAISFYEQALAIKHEIGDRSGEAGSLNNLGTAYGSLERYPQAIYFFQQSLAIQREIGDRKGEANSLNNLGNTYRSLRQYPQAINFLQQSLTIQREIGDRKGEANSLNNLGSAFRSVGQYPQAINFLQQSLAIKREIGDCNGEADSLFNMGNALARLNHGQRYEALQSYQQALAIYEALKLDHMIEKCKKAIAEHNRIVPMQQTTAPSIGESKPGQNEWREKSLPTSAQMSPSRPVRPPLARWQQWGLCFLVGLTIVLIVWWLR
jgi:tetratricopeptide (TPR) repeat protein